MPRYRATTRRTFRPALTGREIGFQLRLFRSTFLIELFADAGFDSEESEIRARMLYYYVLGEAYVTRKESRSIRLKRIERKAQIFTATG